MLLYKTTKCTSCHGNCFVCDHPLLRAPCIARPGTVGLINSRIWSSTSVGQDINQGEQILEVT